MVTIDKTDTLYKYLLDLEVDDIDSEYMNLANDGRVNISDIRTYYQDFFRPSSVSDIDENELEKILDYYVDLKQVKNLSIAEQKSLIKEFRTSGKHEYKEKVVTANLKDMLLNCINYKSLHPAVDLQDLIQVANIGLIEAIDKWKIESKLGIKDYIIYYTRKIIIDEFEEKNNG